MALAFYRRLCLDIQTRRLQQLPACPSFLCCLPRCVLLQDRKTGIATFATAFEAAHIFNGPKGPGDGKARTLCQYGAAQTARQTAQTVGSPHPLPTAPLTRENINHAAEQENHKPCSAPPPLPPLTHVPREERNKWYSVAEESTRSISLEPKSTAHVRLYGTQRRGDREVILPKCVRVRMRSHPPPLPCASPAPTHPQASYAIGYDDGRVDVHMFSKKHVMSEAGGNEMKTLASLCAPPAKPQKKAPAQEAKFEGDVDLPAPTRKSSKSSTRPPTDARAE